MYRNQQTSYSNLNQGNFSRRLPNHGHILSQEGAPSATYFEESPDLNLRQGAVLSMNQELQGGYPSRFNENPSSSFYNQNQIAGPMMSGGRQFTNQSQMMASGPIGPLFGQFQNYQPTNVAAPRINQSEESGGGQGGAVMDSHLDNEEFEDDQQEDLREGENDIEYIIMNLFSKMKNLEGKYIDLANYYKQELFRSSAQRASQDFDNNPITGVAQNSLRNHLSTKNNTAYNLTSPNRERIIEVDQSAGKDSPQKGPDMPQERQILQDLVDEKRKLEEDMKQMIAMRGSIHGHQMVQHQQSPPKYRAADYKTNIPSKEQMHFLKQQLSEALDGIVENLDSSQKKELQYLSTKQNEMYQLASRYNLPAQVKNESLGLWYDAKTKVTSIMGDLKTHVQQKKKQIEGDLISSQINSDRDIETENNGDSLRNQLEQLNKNNDKHSSQINQRFLDDFKKELASIKKKQDNHQKLVQKLKGQLRFKEGLLKDEHSKLNSILRDLKQNLTNYVDINKRLLSGDKNNQNLLLSPFEKKIATYQKSAEMRKQNVDRSGSRGRHPGMPGMSNTGSGFYKYNNDLQNPQILQNISSQQQNTDQEQDLRVIRQKFKNFELSFDDFTNKLIIKNQDISEFERQVDTHSQEELRGISSLDQLISYYSQNQKNGIVDNRSKSRSRLQPDSNHVTTSPAGSNGYSSKDQDKKFIELQRNNEQIYQELRKANEKYLNQRVENNKLKDENQILKNNLEEAQTQIRKLQNSSQLYDNNGQSNSRTGGPQRVNSKQRPNRYDLSQNNQNMFGQSQQRQHSNNSSQLQRENDELRKRVQELEKECFSLTYYQQEMQRRGPGQMDPYTRQMNQENGDLKNKLDQLCLQVQKFMLAMKRLQRAVNNKDKDIQNLKAEFEKNKKILEQMVKDLKEKEMNKSHQEQHNEKYANMSTINQPTHSSMMVGVRDSRFGNNDTAERAVSSSLIGIQPLRNRSQAPNDLGMNAQSFPNRQQQQYSITQRPAGQQSEDLNQSNGNLPPKKGQIRPKGQQQLMIQQNMTPVQNNQSHYNPDMNTPEPYNRAPQQFNKTDTLNIEQQDAFNNLLEEVKQMTEERDHFKQKVEELKLKIENESIQRNAAEQQSSQRGENINKLNNQIKQTQDRIQKLEKILNDYKEGFISLENTPNISQLGVSKIKTDLLYKEKELIAQNQLSHREKFIAFGSTSTHIQTLNSGLSQEERQKFEQLKQHLLAQIQQKELEFEQQFNEVEYRLSEKEQDLEQVKKLFVDKLKELESSFVELSQDMIDSEQVQMEASRKYQNKQHQQLKQSMVQNEKEQSKQRQNQQLEKSIENIIGGGNEDIQEEFQEQIDQLTQMNEQLSEENNELRLIIKQLQKDLQQQDDLMLLRAQYDELQEINDKQENDIHKLQTDLESSKKQSTQFKQQLEKSRSDLQEALKTKESITNTYSAQMDDLEGQLKELELQISQEQEQRIFFESEFNRSEKLLKQSKTDKSQVDQQRDKLLQREKDLLQQIGQLKEEIEHINTLRRGEVSFETMADNDKQVDLAQVAALDEEETHRIENNPKEAALHYLRLLKATKKEFKIMTHNRDKIQVKYDDVKDKFDTLKSESRKNVEEIMNMESKIFELENLNKRLQTELERTRGTSQVEEEQLRRQVEEQFKNKLDFKDSEIEQMTIKVARVSQTNIELTQRINRLVENNSELMQENENMRNHLQTLEMELEMTKMNNDRDIEQIQQQKEEVKKDIDERIQAIHKEKIALQDKINKKKDKIQQIRQKQSQEEIMKELVRQSLESRLHEMKEQVEKEKQIKNDIEKQKMQQLNDAEEQLINLKKQLLEKMENQEVLKDEKHSEQISKMHLQHQQELEQLEEKYRQEQNRIQRESEDQEQMRLLELKEQLEQDKQTSLKELMLQRQQREQELVSVMQERQKELQKQLLLQQEQLIEEKNQELQNLKINLQKQNQDALSQKDKERNLIFYFKQRIFKLQQHVRSLLQQELQNAIDSNNQLKYSIEQQKQLNSENIDNLETKLRSEIEETRKQKDREAKLIYKLQQHIRLSLEKQLRDALEENQQMRSGMDATQSQGLQQLEQIKSKLEQEKSKELRRKDKERTLIFKLQQQIRFHIEKDLKQAIQEKKILEQELEIKQQSNLQQLQELEQRLSQTLEEEKSKKDKQSKLIYKLQQHAKQILQQNLKQAHNDNAFLVEKIEETKSDHEQELKEIEKLKLQELALIQQKLKQELEEDNIQKIEKINKERSIVQERHMKAREELLKQLDSEKNLRLQQEKQHKEQIDKIIQENLDEKTKIEHQYQQRLHELTHNLEKQNNDQLKGLRKEQKSQLESVQAEFQSKLQRKQSEIERLQREQEDLVKSLSEKQDQQTQDLLNQKEREKDQLREDIERMQQELESKYQKDIEDQDKKQKMMSAIQDKIRLDLENKLKEQMHLLEEANSQREKEIQQLNTIKEEEIQKLKGETQQERDRIMADLEKERLIKIQAIEEKEQEAQRQINQSQELLNKIKEERLLQLEEKQQEINNLNQQVQDQRELIKKLEIQVLSLQDDIQSLNSNHKLLLENHLAKIQSQNEEIENLNSQINQITQDNDEQLNLLQNQAQEQEQQYDQQIQQLKSQIKILKDEIQQKTQEIEDKLLLAKQEHQKLQAQEQIKKSEEIEKLKQHLELDHLKALNQKDQEKSMFEKMQSKIRDQLKSQVEEKERLHQKNEERLRELEQNIQEAELEILNQKQSGLLTISELNQNIDKLRQDKQNQKNLIQQLESQIAQIKQSQNDSQNERVNKLQDQVTQLNNQLQSLQKEKAKQDHEVESLKQQIKEKSEEIQNLGDDMEGFAKDLEDQRNINEQMINQHQHKLDLQKKEYEMQIKLKDSQIVQLQNDINEYDLKIQEKILEINQETERRQKEKKKAQELEAQLKALQVAHEEDLDVIQKENASLKTQVDKLTQKARQAATQNKQDQSMDEIEMRLGEFDVQLSELKKQQDLLDSQKQLNISLLDSAEKDSNAEVIGDLNSDQLQFCKRVKYQEQAWYLLSKQGNYYWINQSKIPLDKLQSINVSEIEDNQGKMDEKLHELRKQKDQIMNLISKSKNGKALIDQEQQDASTAKAQQDEIKNLKEQLNQSLLANVALQQSTIQLKQKINELNDMIVGLADTDKSHESISKIVDLHRKKEELSQKLLEQFELTQKLENENDSLKKQLQEQEYSFARGGGKSFAGLRPENFDINTSSIDQQNDEDNYDGMGQKENVMDKLKRLEAELEEYQKQKNDLQGQNKSLKSELQQVKEKVSQSNLSQHQQVEAQEAFETLKHSKYLFIQFIEHIPINAQEHEQRLSILYSILGLSTEEINNLNNKRAALTQKNIQDNVKKGVLGGLFNKKK